MSLFCNLYNCKHTCHSLLQVAERIVKIETTYCYITCAIHITKVQNTWHYTNTRKKRKINSFNKLGVIPSQLLEKERRSIENRDRKRKKKRYTYSKKAGHNNMINIEFKTRDKQRSIKRERKRKIQIDTERERERENYYLLMT